MVMVSTLRLAFIEARNMRLAYGNVWRGERAELLSMSDHRYLLLYAFLLIFQILQMLYFIVYHKCHIRKTIVRD